MAGRIRRSRLAEYRLAHMSTLSSQSLVPKASSEACEFHIIKSPIELASLYLRQSVQTSDDMARRTSNPGAHEWSKCFGTLPGFSDPHVRPPEDICHPPSWTITSKLRRRQIRQATDFHHHA
jgi:hypothetical protein